MAASIHTPHDKFFKRALSDQRVAHAFFDLHLPATIKQLVDLKTLQRCQESYVDEQLHVALTDILFSVEFAGKPGYLYTLVEHQSTPDKWMPFRLLRYMVRIMDHHLRENQTTVLPLVYPLVFYHGQLTPYPYSTDLFDLFAEPTLAERLLFKPFQLIEAQQIPDETLRQQLWIGVVELCLKHIFDRDILPLIQEWLTPLQTLTQAGGQDIVKAALTYIMATGEVSNPQAFIETIHTGLSPELGDSIMTIAQQLEAKGRAEGEAKGIEKGKAEGKAEEQQAIAKRCLLQGLPVEIISQITGLSLDSIQHLKASSPH